VDESGQPKLDRPTVLSGVNWRPGVFTGIMTFGIRLSQKADGDLA
jgi:hypothetical protein